MSIWKEYKLGDVCTLINGAAFKSNEFQETGIPVLKIANVKPNKILLNDLKCVSEEVAAKKAKSRIQFGDILLTMTGNRKDGGPDSWVGKAAIFREKGHFMLNQRVCIVRVDKSKVDNVYLAYLLSSWDAQLYFINHSTSSGGQANISPSIVNDYSILLPDIETQKKIAGLLNRFDLKVRTNNKINRNLQEQAFTLFDHMVAEHSSGDVCNLSDFADINPKRNLSKNTEARCIDMAKLSTSGAFPDGWDYKTYTGGMKFKNGDTILARITPCLENGKTAYINFLEVDEVAFGSTEYIVLAPKGAVPPELLYCLARYPRFVDYAVINMNGTSGRQRVSGEIIGQYQVPRFTEIELEEFASSVAVLFEKMKQNSIESMRLAEVRNILLPQLMSGELDVSDIKI